MSTSCDVVSVDASEARKLMASGHHYLDVRMVEDFNKAHVEGALNVPYYSSVTPEGKVKNPQFLMLVSALCAKDENIIVGCRTGVRAKYATADLLNAGFKNVKHIQGGYVAWLESAPIEKKPNF